MNAMPALLKILVLLAIFLSASNVNAFTSLSPVAGSQVQKNHLIRFEKLMSKPTNEPSSKPIRKLNGINTSQTFEAVNGINAKQFEAVNGINTSYTFEAVNGVNDKQFETVNGINTSWCQCGCITTYSC